MVKCYLKNIPIWKDDANSFRSNPIHADDLNYIIENLECFRIYISFNEKYNEQNNTPIFNVSLGGDSEYKLPENLKSVEELLDYTQTLLFLAVSDDSGERDKIIKALNIISHLLSRFKGAE